MVMQRALQPMGVDISTALGRTSPLEDEAEQNLAAAKTMLRVAIGPTLRESSDRPVTVEDVQQVLSSLGLPEPTPEAIARLLREAA